MQPEREVDPPSRIRHQRAFDAILEIHHDAQTAARPHTMPTGARESAPDVRPGALGERRAGFDVATSCSVSGPGI
jgi:hypothetical protein